MFFIAGSTLGVGYSAFLVCPIYSNTQSEGDLCTAGDCTEPASTYAKINSQTCATTSIHVGGQTYTDYYPITSKTDCETAATYASYTSSALCADGYATTVTDTSIPPGCVCDDSSGSDELKFNLDSNTVAATYSKMSVCETKRTRRNVPAQLCGYEKRNDKKCKEELGDAARVGCQNAILIFNLFWVNLLFTLLGVVFFSVTSCGNCCKRCCGGYATQMKITKIYAGFAAMWAGIVCILRNASWSAPVADLSQAGPVNPNAVRASSASPPVIFGYVLIPQVVVLFPATTGSETSGPSLWVTRAPLPPKSSSVRHTLRGFSSDFCPSSKVAFGVFFAPAAQFIEHSSSAGSTWGLEAVFFGSSNLSRIVTGAAGLGFVVFVPMSSYTPHTMPI